MQIAQLCEITTKFSGSGRVQEKHGKMQTAKYGVIPDTYQYPDCNVQKEPLQNAKNLILDLIIRFHKYLISLDKSNLAWYVLHKICTYSYIMKGAKLSEEPETGKSGMERTGDSATWEQTAHSLSEKSGWLRHRLVG